MQEHNSQQPAAQEDTQPAETGLLHLNFSVLWHNFRLAVRHLFWIPLILALLFGGLMAFRSRNPSAVTYTCRAVFAVSANYSSSTDILSYNYYYDSAAATQLSATFPYILGSDAMKMLIRQDLGTDSINGTISASSVADAGLFVLSVTSQNPDDAYNILNSIIRVYPQAATAVLGDTQITMIDEPVLPTEPDSSDESSGQIFTWFLMGLVLGLVLIFLISLLRKTVHAAEDLRSLVNLPCLAYLPQVRLKRRSKNTNQNITIQNSKTGIDFRESVRMLRLKTAKALENVEGCKVILVTSTLPNEGKSTVSTNLALSFAAEGSRVILVDADLRNQSLKGTLGIDAPSEGLVELLNHKTNQFRLLNVPHSTLLLLSGDETDAHPQRLLDSKRMGKIIDSLKQQLDYIIIDTPPAGILSDAATLAKYADAALYVVRQDLASTTQIYDSIQALATSEVKIIGSVLNGTQAGTNRYGYGSKYGYSYGYGSKYGNGYGYRYGKYGYAYGYGEGKRSSGFDSTETDELSAVLNQPNATGTIDD